MPPKKKTFFPQHLVGRPGFLESQDEIFKSENEMRAAISALIHYLKKSSSNARSLQNVDVLNFMLQEIRVEFSRDVDFLSIRSEYATSSYRIVAPTIDGESDEAQREREKNLLRDFLPTIAESQIRATIQIYRTLSQDARKKLVRRYGVSSIYKETKK